jgi:hypothetical protein
MPLIKSTSKQAVGKNIAREIRAGKKPAQAAAIAYSVQRDARKTGSHSSQIEELGSAYESNSVSSGARPHYHPVVRASQRKETK